MVRLPMKHTRKQNGNNMSTKTTTKSPFLFRGGGTFAQSVN